MSRELPDYKRANRTVPCPRCEAEPGQSCRTPGGHATYDHAARSNLVSTAFRIGIEGGLKDALDLMAADPEQCRDLIWRQYRFVRDGNLRREADQ